ncbi:hypothetical protein PHMEG_00014794 [Phytophthora megakarya]|uniref:Uncharacterized protein n=1 Tax=Phytophthora megakarya TaxID=4795 RepID=A0A225W3E3_9STRA|nr:hypothetical protein PHMEG_00014794 [Phytophthora megakarya]
MSIFGGSERFPTEAARSPGPIYTKPDIRANARVIMKADYRPLDETRRWGMRESWIGDSGVAPGQYDSNFKSIKTRAPKMSFPKSDRFLSQKVSVTAAGHLRELIAADSPGPKYNVDCLVANGGRTAPPRYSFAAPLSPKFSSRADVHKTRLPDVNGSRSDHRGSWLSVINRNGVLVMPTSSARQQSNQDVATPEQARTASPEETMAHPPNQNARGKYRGNAFGHEHRFGKRHMERMKPRTPTTRNTRVQFVSAPHLRENMGEFSPGPIYTPYNPECPGGRLAPSPRRQPAASPVGPKDPHANPSSRSSWLAGAVRKSAGQETVLLRMGDVLPGPGSYAEPPSSFTTFSHNAKTRTRISRPSIRPTGTTLRPPPTSKTSMTRPAEPADDEP